MPAIRGSKPKPASWRGIVLALAFLPCAGVAHAQFGKPFPTPPKLPPNPLKQHPEKKSWLDRNKDSNSTKSDDKAPVERLGNFDIGQRIRCDLPTKGSRGIARFKAIKGTKLSFSAATTGKLGSSTMSLTREDGALVKAFKQDGRRFEIADVEVPESGTYHVKFLHDGDGAIQFVMGTRAEIPDKIEANVGIAKDGARNIGIDGGEGRTITGIDIVPVTPGETIDARVTITDDHHEKIASLEGFGLKPVAAEIKMARGIPIDEYVEYRCDIWLLRGTSPQNVVVRIRFDNPPPATGTVDLHAP
jgi:hypothetical protein